MNKPEQAVQYFNSGFNCAQAILAAFCGDYGMDSDLACRIACGFGAGMGRLCETCGAVSGAYMVIGLKYGNISETDRDAREKSYTLVREFERRFKERNQSTVCEDLLGTHMVTGDQEKAVRQVAIVCPKAVRDAAEILAELLDD